MPRLVPRIELLDSEAKERIHQASLSILNETGILIDSEWIADLLKEKGVRCQASGKIGGRTLWRVWFAGDLVTRALETAPTRFTLCGRDPRFDLALDGEGSAGSVFFGSLGSAPVVHDLKTGQRRLGTLKDLTEFARLTQQLDNLDFFHVSVMPSDVPKSVVELYRWKATFENTAKHSITAAVYDSRNLPFLLEMAALVQGGEEELRRRPLFTATECPIAPLFFAERSAENIVDLARAGLPVIIYSEPFAGASSPVTLAGTLAVTNAEALAGITLTQLANPGAPVIYGSVATTMDLYSGNVSFGSPETGLLSTATTEMARFYRIPNQTCGGRTDAKQSDCQAGFEKQGNLLFSALAGANLNNFGGELESNYAVSLSQLVIDDEIIKRVRRSLEGISLEAETLAQELVDSIGPRGQYLGQKHTLDHMRREISVFELSSKSTYEGWLKEGGLSITERAKEKAEKLLQPGQTVPLEKGLVEEMAGIIERAERMHHENR